MQKSKEEIMNIVMLACSAAVFFISPIFLMEVIVDRCPFITFLYIVVSDVVYYFAMIDKDKKEVLIKWLISIPIGLFIWWSFVRCEYAIRALNWVNPGYGRRSAGGTLYPSFLMLLLIILCLIGLIISFFGKPKQYERFRKIQFVICICLMVVIVLVAYILAIQLPSAASLYG